MKSDLKATPLVNLSALFTLGITQRARLDLSTYSMTDYLSTPSVIEFLIAVEYVKYGNKDCALTFDIDSQSLRHLSKTNCLDLRYIDEVDVMFAHPIIYMHAASFIDPLVMLQQMEEAVHKLVTVKKQRVSRWS